MLEALRAAHGELPLGEEDKGYGKLLEDRTYRAWKAVAPDDPQAQRFLAEAHAMRAFAAAFLILFVVTLLGAYIYRGGDMTWRTHGTLSVLYALLFLASLWRMENKAVTFARHALVTFTEKVSERKGSGEQS